MSETKISIAASGIILVEQYCAEEQEVHTVLLTQDDVFDICGIVWPAEQARWIEICQAEGKPWPPVEKNPQGALAGPEGV